jgi:CheY-like chemotaxis protein/putative methionine-R-sulfoxide reductase with GAF domain
MERFFEIIAKSLSECFQISYIAFFKLSQSGDRLILKYALGFHPESLENLRRIRPTAGIFKALIEKGTPQIENEIFPNEKKLAASVRWDGLESMIAVPIFSKDEIWGALAVFSQQRFKFKKEDGEIMSLWAAHVGELQDLFSSDLQAKLHSKLVQVLGNIELIKFRLRKKESIQTSDVMDAFDRLENMILESVPDISRYHQRLVLKKKPEEEPVEEVISEEVVTVEGEKPGAAEKRRVLIVDDQPIITDLLVDILKRMGYSSEVAMDGKEGIKAFAKDGFDLVITDLGMPGLSGWEVSRSVKEQNPSVPVILITGSGVEPDPHKIRDSGIDFVINKPFQINQLERIVRELTNPGRNRGVT